MKLSASSVLSIVVPIYNEAAALPEFHKTLIKVIQTIPLDYEILYCNDGSTDNTNQIVRQLHQKDSKVRGISLSRNFGKENALSAGIATARGNAILMLDGDGQHPVELIPEFIAAWQAGAKVVVGVRSNTHTGLFKRLYSRLFYMLVNISTSQKLVPGSTDFRLIDQVVQQAFLNLKETDRITRGLIDWLGFGRHYIRFSQKERVAGTPGYGYRKLIKLAIDTILSLSPELLHVIFYLGAIITIIAVVLGVSVGVEQLILHDPLGWKFTGTAMLGILILFLVGLVVVTQGIMSAYIATILTQTKQRPLYIIDYEQSSGLENK